MKGSSRFGAGAEGADGNEGHAESQWSDEEWAAGSQGWLRASCAQHSHTEKDQFYHILKYLYTLQTDFVDLFYQISGQKGKEWYFHSATRKRDMRLECLTLL